MNSISLKQQILELLPAALKAHHDFIDSLTSAERAAAGTPQEWAAKDILTHCIFWEETLVERLECARSGATPSNSDDIQALNEKNFEARRNRAWDEIIADLDTAFQKLAEQTRALAEADLSEAGRFPWQGGGRPLWRSICSWVYMHPCMHFTEVYIKRGDLAAAKALQEALVSNISKLDNGSGRGAAIYSMACAFALAGQPDDAISLLAESLKLDSTLTDLSKRDSDLVSLREMPAYKALYAAQVSRSLGESSN